jgi:threonine dehydrogenase-like Zn-dependent dehydrogenase
LIIGHESLGRVLESPTGLLNQRELVVATVRRPDPEPCINCAAGEFDMCLNSRYTERGIKGAHGFLVERFVENPEYLVPVPASLESVGVLLEPLSIVEKAVEQIYRIQSRSVWSPKRALITGAGSIGTLATLLLRLDDLEVFVYNRGSGGKGRTIAEAAGAQFISADTRQLDHNLEKDVGPIDIVIEATGHSPLAFAAMHVVGPNGVICLTGISPGSRDLTIDASHLNLEVVLGNKLLFGTVNASRRHFERGIEHMQAIQERWPRLLETMITRRVPLDRFSAHDIDPPGELKVVVDVAAR